ncbi:peroxisomal trans-2-enoyl-CoA reductase-like isoform X2 [Halichondria panicea]|uniref:peroxisomal trans-2-enoyl-CoA reductase-like isoform X2 n=1 Tax=Halichondria panicea TaxID=6063 RepID=UPI00312B40C8
MSLWFAPEVCLDVEALMDYTVQQHGRIDYLVNNGGGQFMSPLAYMKTKGWNAVIDTNLNGTYYCLKHAYHKWMKENGGSIVNIIVDMLTGFPGMAHTGAARAAVENMSKSLAVEWASDGVRINNIAPGVIYSPTAAANYKSDDVFDMYLENIPARRVGYPEEISGAVCFLLSPAASYTTGVTVAIDGAWGLYKKNYEVPDHEGKWPLGVHSDYVKSKL